MKAQAPRVTQFKVISPKPLVVAVSRALNVGVYYPRIIKTVLSDGKNERTVYNQSTY